MAAPSNTKWGSRVGSYGRIGISVTLTNISNTQTKRHTEIWFWSKYGLSDSSNTFYYDDQSSTATTSKGSVNIRTTVTSGNGWSTSNQVKIAEYDYTWSRGTSASKKNVAAKLTGIERVGGTMTATTSYMIPAKPSYTIKYNANGGSGAPGKQTKWYGTTLKLSSTKPTRTGYTFRGWSTKNDSSVEYVSGANYTANAAVTLYAVWKANTYTVSYNANGGSGAPGKQTKTYGSTLTLSRTKPTRTNYTFKGWGTSANSTTVAYAAGSSYTVNASITLYAIWELSYTAPRITNLKADRCNSSGTLTDSGTYCKVTFSWSTDKTVSSGSIKWVRRSATATSTSALKLSGTSGSVSTIVGSNAINTEYVYDLTVTITDASGTSTATAAIPAMTFIMDILNGGMGLAIGKPATKTGFNIGWNTDIDIGKVLKAGGVNFMSFQSTGRPTLTNHTALANGKYLQGQLSSGAFSNILRMSSGNQVELDWTSNGLGGRPWKLLWSGTWSSGSITIPELPYYNFFMFRVADTLTMVPVYRYMGNVGSSTDARGDDLRGVGAYPYISSSGSEAFLFQGFNGTISGGTPGVGNGTKLTMKNAHQLAIYYKGTTSNRADISFTNIFGVI